VEAVSGKGAKFEGSKLFVEPLKAYEVKARGVKGG